VTRQITPEFVSCLIGNSLTIGIAEVSGRLLFPYWNEFNSKQFTAEAFIDGRGSG
jgi:hypothetical protein